MYCVLCSSQKSSEIGPSTTSILEKKISREVESFAQGHTVGKVLNWDSNLNLLAPKSRFFIITSSRFSGKRTVLFYLHENPYLPLVKGEEPEGKRKHTGRPRKWASETDPPPSRGSPPKKGNKAQRWEIKQIQGRVTAVMVPRVINHQGGKKEIHIYWLLLSHMRSSPTSVPGALGPWVGELAAHTTICPRKEQARLTNAQPKFCCEHSEERTVKCRRSSKYRIRWAAIHCLLALKWNFTREHYDKLNEEVRGVLLPQLGLGLGHFTSVSPHKVLMNMKLASFLVQRTSLGDQFTITFDLYACRPGRQSLLLERALSLRELPPQTAV